VPWLGYAVGGGNDLVQVKAKETVEEGIEGEPKETR